MAAITNCYTHTIPKELHTTTMSQWQIIEKPKSIFPSHKSHYGTEILLNFVETQIISWAKKKHAKQSLIFLMVIFFCSNSFSKSCAATTKFKEKCHIKVSLEKTNLCSLSPILKHFHLCVPRCFWNLFHGILHTSSYLTFCF